MRKSSISEVLHTKVILPDLQAAVATHELIPLHKLGKSGHSPGGGEEGLTGEVVALAGGGMAHTGGAKTRARVLFLKSTPKTWF